MKSCTKCRTPKALDQFHTDKRAKDGRRSQCKACSKANTQSWRAANPERDREATRARVAADPEAVAARKAAWLRDNPGKGAEYSRRYRETHPERAAAAKTRYRVMHADRIKALSDAWRAANPDKVRAIDASRRARKLDAVTGPVDYAALRASVSDCYLCGRLLDSDIHMDHVVPLARGGAHCMDNLRPTHAACNRRKADLLLSELTWYGGAVDLGVSLHPSTLGS